MDYPKILYDYDRDSCNFYCKGDVAYTEDYVLVYNVYAYKIHRKITHGALFQHFAQYGKVKHFNLVSDKKRFSKVAFIHFEEPQTALKVLNRRHQINRLNFKVKACDSWRQPDAQFGKRFPVECGYSFGSEDETCGMPNVNATAQLLLGTPSADILQLNDDCLENVCHMLTLSDQLRFSLTCKRFRNAFLMSAKSRFRSLNMEWLQKMTLWEVFELLKLIGSYVERLEGHVPFKDRERIFGFLSRYVTNVVSLNFECCKITAPCLRKLVDKFQMITDLGLPDCYLNDAAVGHLQRLTNLQTLTLSDNCQLTGRNVATLITVKNLYIRNCTNIQPIHMIAIFKALTELQTLDIRRCERLDGVVLMKMVENCANLETLKMSIKENSACIAELPKLKHLELLSSFYGLPTQIHQTVLDALVKHKSQQLKVLKIISKNILTKWHIQSISLLESLMEVACPNNCGINDSCLDELSTLKNLEILDIAKCTDITNAGLLRLVKKCPKLKALNIKYCHKIDNGFILDVIPLLKLPQHIAQLPLILRMKGCEALEETLDENPFYVENKSCVDIRNGYDINRSFDSLSAIDYGDQYGDDDDDEDFFNDGDNFFDYEIDEDDDFYNHLIYVGYNHFDEDADLFNGYAPFLPSSNGGDF